MSNCAKTQLDIDMQKRTVIILLHTLYNNLQIKHDDAFLYSQLLRNLRPEDHLNQVGDNLNNIARCLCQDKIIYKHSDYKLKNQTSYSKLIKEI